MNIDKNLPEAMKKLNFLLHNSLFPPESFQNLLFLYCKYQFYDLAQELMIENPKLCETLLDKNDYAFLKTLVTTQTDQSTLGGAAQFGSQQNTSSIAKDALHTYQLILNSYRVEMSQLEKELRSLKNAQVD